jgi:hypothetical protein
MTDETRDRKASERRMKPASKTLRLCILKIGSLLGVAIFIFQIAPTREGYEDTIRIETSTRKGDGGTAVFLSSGRHGRERLFPVEKPFLTEEGRFDSWHARREPLDQRSTVNRRTSYRTEDSDEDSVAGQERKILMAMTPRARIDAVEALTQTNELDKAREVLSRVAIIDQNPDVRLAALEALDEIDAVPFETLADVAWYDSDPSVRLSAVELIGEAKEKGMRVVEFLRRVAKMDSSNEVRQLASNFVSAVMNGK